MMNSSLSSLTMPGPSAFSNPFESAQRNGHSHINGPSAIGSGRVRTGSSNNRQNGHSPTTQSRRENFAVRMRKLPQTATRDTVQNMLVFAKDFTAIEMLPSLTEDHPYLTAMVQFRTSEAAMEVARALDGKKAGADSPEMIVELVTANPEESVNGRRLPDTAASNGAPAQNSRYSETFRDMDRVSPSQSVNSTRNHAEGGVIDGASPTFRDTRPGNGATFTRQSPIGHGLERQHVSGRSMIEADGADDETNQIMQDPGSWMSAANERQMQAMQQGRRATAPNISSLGSRMGSLSINSNVGSSLGGMHANGVVSPRGQNGFQTPVAAPFSPPGMHGMNMYNNAFSNATSPTSSQYQPQSYRAQTLPPVNPADQNPPCNTLYVGNLPMDTSEDELKQMFSKARGYRRLCFRMKGNGPMCFVEFEDISHATRALKDYYGMLLSNSVRGGIRLSFSKNPLGVRGNAQQSPISPGNIHGGGPGGNGSMVFNMPSGNLGVMASQNFATASGPPPGLPTPQSFSAVQRQRTASVVGQAGTGLASPVGFTDASRAFNFYGR